VQHRDWRFWLAGGRAWCEGAAQHQQGGSCWARPEKKGRRGPSWNMRRTIACVHLDRHIEAGHVKADIVTAIQQAPARCAAPLGRERGTGAGMEVSHSVSIRPQQLAAAAVAGDGGEVHGDAAGVVVTEGQGLGGGRGVGGCAWIRQQRPVGWGRKSRWSAQTLESTAGGRGALAAAPPVPPRATSRGGKSATGLPPPLTDRVT
jgi:hypothetical protein